MRRRHRLLVAAGLLAPACSAAPTAQRGRDHISATPPADISATPPADAGPDATVVDEATTSTGPATSPMDAGSPSPASAGPTTTAYVVTVPTDPPTTTTVRPRPLPTTTLPERADESMGDVEWLIRQTFPEAPDKAVRVARCESRLQPGAISPDGANWGVMQINVVHRGLAAGMGYSWDQMLQVGPNLAVARAVYDAAGGWGPWSCA